MQLQMEIKDHPEFDNWGGKVCEKVMFEHIEKWSSKIKIKYSLYPPPQCFLFWGDIDHIQGIFKKICSYCREQALKYIFRRM